MVLDGVEICIWVISYYNAGDFNLWQLKFRFSSNIIIKRNLFEIGFKGIHFEAENQFYNLSKETEAPQIQGHPKDRDHH